VNTDAATPLRLWMVTAGLSVIAALLGYVGLTYYLNERPEYAGAEPFDRVYYTLQLFILSSTPLGGPPYGPMLSIAMYLAPLTTVLAVLQAVSAVFRARFAAWVLLRKRTLRSCWRGTGRVCAGQAARRDPADGPGRLQDRFRRG